MNTYTLGAGVSGLTTAISLLRNGYKNVKVIAKHLPGDFSSEYASPWAGASILTVAEANDYRLQGNTTYILNGIIINFIHTEIDMYTMKEFGRLEKEEPEANIIPCPGIQYVVNPEAPGTDPYWVRKIYKNVSGLYGLYCK